MKRENIIPYLPLARLLKKIGAKRVSKSALVELSSVLEERLTRIVEEAIILAKHSGRKTITAEDIRMARKRLNL